MYEGRWGCYQNAVAVWSGHMPRVELKICLLKDGYYPVETKFRLDKLFTLGGDVPVDLGAVLLGRIEGGQGNQTMK
jgi:hypothetical protein